MILADSELERLLQTGRLGIWPQPPEVQPASVELTLGPDILVPIPMLIDISRSRPPDPNLTPIPEDTGYPLAPDKFVNVMTAEWVEILPDLVGIVVGKSSLARYGLQVESAGYVDPGWNGHLTLELKNLGPHTLILRAGMKIAQLRVEYMTGPALRPYGSPGLGSHYQGARRPEMAGRSGV